MTATDPDDAQVEVSFHGAPRGPGSPSGSDFTLMVLPDTQNYILTTANMPVLNSQLQWIVAERDRLSLAYVAGVGDIVDNQTSAAQWSRANNAYKILDDGGVPSAVVPGNHDFDLATGAFAGYDANFPVSRYSAASWNSPTARYGGYYGQSQFGPDPVDRRNMNSYSLFTAGGMDFLLLSLELNAPDDVVAWAQRVLSAHPDRRAILATHSFVNVAGAFSTQVVRTDVPGNSGAALWQKLVYPNCQIFLVVNGHFTDGLDGEANRSDANACGRQVQSALSDYQGRPNGGDGWLRYYTFSPARDEVTATTYSPWLGTRETDADSAFAWSYDMTAPPVESPLLGTVTVPSGGTARLAAPTLSAGTVFDWYATVDDGTSVTRGPTWSFTAGSSAPPVLAQDTFTRTTASGWGTAEMGGAWTVNSTTKFSVSGGMGRVMATAGSTLNATLGAISSTDTSVAATVSVDKLADQVLTSTVMGRVVGTASYGARLRLNSNGTVAVQLMRDATVLGGGSVAGSIGPSSPISVRVDTLGTSPTTLRVRVWPAGAPEPTSWNYTVTDATPALQSAGSVRLSTYLWATATNGPVNVGYDNLSAVGVGSTPPPANVPPVAAFTATTSGLTVSTDSGGSTDSDGVIVSRSWSFGGVVKAGQTASHTFGTAGQYPVTLTVTDDDGASASSTQTVTVSAPPTSAIAADAFSRTVATGWGTADAGGPWTVNSAAKTSVSSGAGRFSATAGSTLTATLAQVASSDVDVQAVVSFDKLPNQYLNFLVNTRVIGSAVYGARVRLNANGSAVLQLMRDGTALAGGALAGLTVPAQQAKLHIRTQATATSPTTLRAKVWLDGSPEPAAWQAVATDSTSALQGTGALGLGAYVSSSTTNGPVTVSVEDIVVNAVP
ncbi:PKD domain-containing protein [Microbacterium sp. DT81.1]|uniref:PKD domain-containing protein n=1 Tax=Microbacterium sp. DT81.1 TaxID=3393413 RepID=UPI003CED7FA1